MLDTGSSSTWVPAHGCGRYCGFPKNTLTPANSSTFNTENTIFSIRYGEGFSRGYYAKDTVTINGVAVPNVVSIYTNSWREEGVYQRLYAL